MTSPDSKKMHPTISLCLIAKNEEKNINRLLDSVEGCFDEIILVDTGSIDNTKEIGLTRGCKVFDFTWINDFSAARNFSLSKATSDFVCWFDLDDVLHGRENFIHWKKHAMQFADCYLATYNYALDEKGKPIISFMRERVFRRSLNPTFRYRIHEGVFLEQAWVKDYALTWSVNHLRDAQDIQQDKSRNIKILEEIRKEGKSWDARLQFYYGKELHESGRSHEALTAFDEALAMELENHDRLLSLQTAASAATLCADQMKDEFMAEKVALYRRALKYCHQGIELDPNRAEFYVGAGDIHLKMGNLHQCIPYYSAAKYCTNNHMNSPYQGAIYSFLDCYGKAPALQLARVYFNIGKIEEAKKEAQEAWEKYESPEAQQMLAELSQIADIIRIDNNQAQTDDIVFTCPPTAAYEFDEELYKTKGMGGSETALIEMARWLKLKTGRSVKIFCARAENKTCESGVEYISNKYINQYLSKNRPHTHIAWRHNIELTRAKTYLWCHDLITSGVEMKQNFDKILCLTPFHKDYVMAKQGVPSEKIMVTRNGIVPEKFDFERPVKNPNKILWMSSPDRGLDRAMYVMDQVRDEFPDLELHVYNGFDNMKKYGMAAEAERLEKMMAERPYVKFHGFTEQKKMYRDVADGVVWLHPCNFIETFCITAYEMLTLGIYPITRRLGALQNTLADAEEKGMATLLDHDCVTPEEISKYAANLRGVLRNKFWENVKFDPKTLSWESLADEWIKDMELAKPQVKSVDQILIEEASL